MTLREKLKKYKIVISSLEVDPTILAMAKTPYDKLCLEIASDRELWEHIVHYVQGDPEAFNDYPELTKKLEATLRKIQPFKPHMTSNLYRGESKSRKFDHPREVESWTPNKDVALDFARNVADPAVRRISTPLLIQGVLVADVGYWRSHLDPSHSHYGDGQSEWLVLRPKKVETVYTKETGWVD